LLGEETEERLDYLLLPDQTRCVRQEYLIIEPRESRLAKKVRGILDSKVLIEEERVKESSITLENSYYGEWESPNLNSVLNFNIVNLANDKMAQDSRLKSRCLICQLNSMKKRPYGKGKQQHPV